MNSIQRAKVVKSVITNRFEVTLFELASGHYLLAHVSFLVQDPHLSEKMSDYNIASSLFDIKLRELEGF